jgi:hypothetical protein
VRLVEFVSEFVCSRVRGVVSDDDLVFVSCGLDQALIVGSDDRGDRHGAVFALEDGVGAAGWDLPGLRDLVAHGLECCA